MCGPAGVSQSCSKTDSHQNGLVQPLSLFSSSAVFGDQVCSLRALANVALRTRICPVSSRSGVSPAGSPFALLALSFRSPFLPEQPPPPTTSCSSFNHQRHKRKRKHGKRHGTAWAVWLLAIATEICRVVFCYILWQTWLFLLEMNR